MEELRDLAVVLRAVQYEEKHRIVTALTEKHGRVSVLARNAIHSRRFGPCLDLFAASEWSFTIRPGADMGSLREANLKRDFSGISKDFERLAAGSFLSEVALKVAPSGVPCVEFFKIHANALAALDELGANGNKMALLNLYLSKVLSWSGIQVQLLKCVRCSKSIRQLRPEGLAAGEIQNAAWVCEDCFESQPPASFAVRALQDLLIGSTESIRAASNQMQATEGEHSKLFQFLIKVVAFHLPGFDQLSLQSLRFLGP